MNRREDARFIWSSATPPIVHGCSPIGIHLSGIGRTYFEETHLPIPSRRAPAAHIDSLCECIASNVAGSAVSRRGHGELRENTRSARLLNNFVNRWTFAPSSSLNSLKSLRRVNHASCTTGILKTWHRVVRAETRNVITSDYKIRRRRFWTNAHI